MIRAQGRRVSIAHAAWVHPKPFVMSKPVPRTDSRPRTADTSMHTKFDRVKEISPKMALGSVVFTANEHLGVQHQIERRAHELWCAGGRRGDTALNDWLQA